jgi:hypothetical protein
LRVSILVVFLIFEGFDIEQISLSFTPVYVTWYHSLIILDSYFVLLAYAKQLWLKEVARYDKFCVGGDDEVFSREKKTFRN